jgi:hypothetical protein
MRRYWLTWVVLITSMLIYGAVVSVLDRMPRQKEKDTLRTAIPPWIQVLLAGGDRYLAANMAVFRATIISAKDLDDDSYPILARVQMDAARLNAANEDNYYTSQAILPWNDQLKADMFIQAVAIDARPWDPLPSFDHYYFLSDPVKGADILMKAAARLSGSNKEGLTTMASQWYEKGNDPQVAINLINSLMKSTRDKQMKEYLKNRKGRVEGLIRLRDAAKLFEKKNNHPPRDINDLVGPGLLNELPKDPIGLGYTLDDNGKPITKSRIQIKHP